MTRVLDRAEARRVFLYLQGLCGSPGRRIDATDVQRLINSIGFVQVDSINTVARAHHHILFARNQTYRPAMLTGLLENERGLFENWTHDASIIPCGAFAYWRHRFARERERLSRRWTNWHGGDFKQELARVRDRIRIDGPAGSRDFDRHDNRKEPGWWNWNPGKVALEYLWRTGEIAVARRDNFAKVYDLAERVIPAADFERRVSHDTFVDWACRSALEKLGIATSGEIAAFYDLITPQEAKDWCAARTDETHVPVEIVLEDGARRKAVARADIDDVLNDAPDPPRRVRALSPFDPVLRDRKRAERLFGFSYRIEVFVPAPKRVYGYYVFPLLEGERLIGRADVTCRRAEGTLLVSALWPEPRVRFGTQRMDLLEAELTRIARFTGMERVVFADDWRRAPKA